MKKLNFFPYYKELLRSKTKTTTLRLGPATPFNEGDSAMITLGWNEGTAASLHLCKIVKVYRRKIRDLDQSDMAGESADCKSPEAAKYVLGAIYRTVLSDEDEIWVVKFRHEEPQ